MKKSIYVYKKIVLKSFSYEKGDDIVQIKCEVEKNNEVLSTQLVILHSDFNRMLSKIISNGYDFDFSNVSSVSMEDGVELFQYQFNENFRDVLSIDEFDFSKPYYRISA